MSIELMKELKLEQLRGVFLKYTRKAFKLLPKIDQPRILDIGCGTGGPTMELTRLTNGEIFGIDIDQEALNKLNLKLEQEGLAKRVKVINRSLYETGFPDEHFDVLWDEGVLHILDIKKSLKECKRLLKPHGFLVIGEVTKWFEKNVKHFPKFGFNLVNKFSLPEECWWTKYYEPLEKRIKEIGGKYNKPEDLEEIKRLEMEIKMAKKNPKEFNCAFYIMQKIVIMK